MRYLLTFLLILWTLPAGAATFYPASALTGGGTGALDKIDGAGLSDGDVAIVVLLDDATYGSSLFTYVLDADSGAGESVPDVISPDTNAGTKRWELVKTTGSGFQTGDPSDPTQDLRYYEIQQVLEEYTVSVSTGDGAGYWTVGEKLDGCVITYVHARVITAGTTGTTDIQLHNVTDAVDVLSTKLTIDSTETGSDTAATPAVINAANDDLAENDVLRWDVDAVSTTAPQGLVVTVGCTMP